MKLSRQSEFLLELYALEKHGVPRTHLECLFWFYLNDGKIVDYDTLQGRYVPGRTKNGEEYVSRRPIQANQTVKGPHILHSTIRGWYKPGGGKILGYDEDAKKIDWDGTDEFVQSLQLAHDPENYDSEITKSDNHGNWLEMVYHHDEKKQYFEIDNGNIQNCFKHKIPVGICEKVKFGKKLHKSQRRIMGLGLITKISKNKRDVTIKLHKGHYRDHLFLDRFSFTNKDFESTGSTKRQDALYRTDRFRKLVDDIKKVLQPEFSSYEATVGKPDERQWTKGAKANYFPYTWASFWETPDVKFDSLGFQVVLSENPETAVARFSVGVWLEGYAKQKKNRTKIITKLKEQKNQVFKILSTLPQDYRISLKYNDGLTRRQEWTISKLKLEDIEYIANELMGKSNGMCSLKIAQYFEQNEAIDLKQNVVDKIAIIFNQLLPFGRFVHGNDITVSSDSKQSLEQIADEILSGDPENGQPEIAVEKDVVLRILIHLDAGKHVILVGAPGVGKTMLAKRILKIYGKIKTGKDYLLSIATAEWSRQHVVGSLDLEDKWNPGFVSEAAKEGQWLLIDEFNRADINKAFGEMFLALEDHKIPLSKKERKTTEPILIPDEFRIVGTMNDYDKNLLLAELSYGLITRFAFVDIKPDEDKEKESVKKQIIENNLELTEEDWDSCSEEIKTFFEFTKKVREWRMIGVRTTIDVIRYMIYGSKNLNDKSKKKLNYLDEALCDYLLPQFDRLDKKTIEETEIASKKMEVTGFTEGLAKMRKDLERMSDFFSPQQTQDDE